MWAAEYGERLKAWHDMRASLHTLVLVDCLAAINDWWWQAPMIGRHLAWDSLDTWPDAWQLLAQDGFCDLARALGIIYTVMMVQHAEVRDLAIIQTETNNLVQVNHEKYILNWSPGIILNTPSLQYRCLQKLQADALITKIG